MVNAAIAVSTVVVAEAVDAAVDVLAATVLVLAAVQDSNADTDVAAAAAVAVSAIGVDEVVDVVDALVVAALAAAVSTLSNVYQAAPMEQHALKNINNCLNTNIYSYLETSGVQSSNPYLNVVHFFNTRVN
jgi:hypothetical protein